MTTCFLTGDDSYAALTNVSDGCVALLQVSGNFMFDAADHRDFLGATLGAGIFLRIGAHLEQPVGDLWQSRGVGRARPLLR